MEMTMDGKAREAAWRTGIALAIFTALGAGATPALADSSPARRMEKLDRGVVAAPALNGGILVSWRLLGDDPAEVAFNLYKGGKRLNAKPLKGATDQVDPKGKAGDLYSVRAVVGGKELAGDKSVAALAQSYLTIPLQQPPGGTTPSGETFTYTANDASVGDLDGDGRYEIVLKWDPTNSKDNAFSGYTGPVILDAYTLDGKRLWRIDLGRNIRAGAHYTQFLVYDFDGDGRAELALRTSDGTTDGQGRVLGDASADWRGKDGEVLQTDRTGAVVKADGTKVAQLVGRMLKGPEYLTVFDGLTGAALASAPYAPPRNPDTDTPSFEQQTALWGDGYANRSDRFLGGVAYLDGVSPSIVMARGYYGRTTLAAWDWRGGKLTQRWLFDSNNEPEGFGGQGNHQLSVADVDGDGRDEILYGSMAVDDTGKGLWTAKLYHGDAMHVSDLDPTRPGLEKFGVHESPGKNGGVGAAMLDARTGEVLWTTPTDKDTGRGLAADIDPRHPGDEAWGTNSDNLYTARGKAIEGVKHPRQTNFAVWWDGDTLRELLDRNQISKWDWTAGETKPLLVAEGMTSNNGTKSTPALSADLLGDWREEVLWRAEDNQSLRLYVTPYPTDTRITTQMHDPEYRLSVAWQNVAYNQPPHPSFFLGDGMKPAPRPNIRTK
jgi:rhamnogalacturonan endolyase